ncbi:hypothetical protein C1645_842495 [Glomus cerebriforme]|uniref:Uncharacterized protein n=1 Tax=Glomus cerebriforme TaxID=658196 RepID=A0A397S1Q8_9GLOM|nr:hypothetical protein C1645_842495 [Glomus cerebriforme]
MATSSTTQNSNNQNQISRLSPQEEEICQNISSSDSNMTNHSSENSSQNVTLPTIPQRALTSSPTSVTSECLPTYSIVIRDMPPVYPLLDQPNLQELPNYMNSRSEAFIEPLLYLEAPILPQEYWPITKKFYVYGFIIWPLWIVGAFYIFLGDEYKYHDQEQGINENENIKVSTGRLKWARRCLLNSLILIILLSYVIVALSKSKGKIY